MTKTDYEKALLAAATALDFLVVTFPDCLDNDLGSDTHYLDAAQSVLNNLQDEHYPV